MRCETCEAAMQERRTTAAAPHPYALGGLPHVALAGILLYECPLGHPPVPLIPRVGELHRVITEVLLRKPTALTGVEVRFLRKHVGVSAQRFAALLAVDPSHLSRVEHGKTRLGASTDRLARAIVLAAAKGGEAVRSALLTAVDATTRRVRRRRRPAAPVFALERNRWREHRTAA